MNGNYYDFKTLIFPHLQPHFKQKKEMNFIYCYNFRFNGEINPNVNKDFHKYMTVMIYIYYIGSPEFRQMDRKETCWS
jgi:hypothetical protein